MRCSYWRQTIVEGTGTCHTWTAYTDAIGSSGKTRYCDATAEEAMADEAARIALGDSP